MGISGKIRVQFQETGVQYIDNKHQIWQDELKYIYLYFLHVKKR